MFARRLRRARRLAATALAAVNLPRPPARPAVIRDDWDYLRARMRWFIRRGMRKLGVPGLSIALINDQDILWAEGFGWADRERRQPAGTETVYQIGSITKVLNALAVMQLVDDDRLALDAAFTDYVPEFSMRTRWPEAPPITPRALLSHHAGLPTYHLKGFFSGQSLDELLAQLRDEHLACEPHMVFNYSNLGPNLLGLMLARLTGRPYAEAMTERLLAPLGLQHTGFTPDGAIGARLARGYVHDRPVDPTPIRDVPAGGLYSNVFDLARLVRCVFAGGMLDGRRVLSAAALAETLAPQYPGCALDFGHRFGLGWMLSGLPVEHGGTQAWHNGGTKAFLSQLALLPDRKLGVVVLANSDNAGNLVYEAAEEALRLALEVRDGIAPPPKVSEPEITLDRDTLARHTGDYSLMGSLARISLGRKRLKLHVLNHKLDLVPVAPGRFRVEYSLLGLKSVPIPFPPVEFMHVAGREFAVLRDRVIIPAEKIPPYPVPAIWERCRGDYHLLNPDTEYLVDLEHCRMEISDGRLLMDIRISGIENRAVKVVLVPLNDHEAYVFGLGRNVGDVSQAFEHEGRVRMRYSGYLFERS
jgi:CubicO group peptidase (beta-lactamase class C family)